MNGVDAGCLAAVHSGVFQWHVESQEEQICCTLLLCDFWPRHKTCEGWYQADLDSFFQDLFLFFSRNTMLK